MRKRPVIRFEVVDCANGDRVRVGELHKSLKAALEAAHDLDRAAGFPSPARYSWRKVEL